MLAVSDVARLLKITPQAVRKAIRDGRVKATKVGSFWILSQADVKRWKDTR